MIFIKWLFIVVIVAGASYALYYFYRMYLYFNALHEEKKALNELKKKVSESNNSEEIKEAMVKYSARFYKIKNY